MPDFDPFPRLGARGQRSSDDHDGHGIRRPRLVFGWLRSIHPTFSRIPDAPLWLFEFLGLAEFIAVVGLQAGPEFVQDLARSGLSLLLAAVVVSLVPHLVGVLAGRYVFRMHPAIVLGVCAGAGLTEQVLPGSRLVE